jgi:hypothetical protein
MMVNWKKPSMQHSLSLRSMGLSVMNGGIRSKLHVHASTFVQLENVCCMRSQRTIDVHVQAESKLTESRGYAA